LARNVDAIQAGLPVDRNLSDEQRANLSVARQLREVQFAPDRAFESELRTRLLRQGYQDLDKTKERFTMRILRTVVRPALVVALGILILAGILSVVSSDVRAATWGTLVRFVEVNTAPSVAAPNNAQPASATNSVASNASVVVLPTVGAADGTVVPPSGAPGARDEIQANGSKQPLAAPPVSVPPSRELVSLGDAQAKVNFHIKVPTTLPAGYQLQGVAAPLQVPASAIKLPDNAPKADLPNIQPPQAVILIFKNSQGDILQIAESVVPAIGNMGVTLPVGQGSSQDVTVKGQKGQYVEGGWTPNGWSKEGGSLLHWVDSDNIMFDMSGAKLKLSDLLPVAESVQ